MYNRLRAVWREVLGNKGGCPEQKENVGSPSSYHNGAALGDADDAFGEAHSAHLSGNLQLAEARYRLILKRFPNYAPALHFLGVVCGQSGNLAEAEDLIRQAIRIEKAAEYYCNLALVLEQQGKLDGATCAYRHAIQLAPGNGKLQCNLGHVLAASGKYAEAEVVYRGAQKCLAPDAELCFSLGVVLGAQNRTTEAADAYLQAISLRPAYADAYNNLGALLTGLGRYQEAEEAYRKALALRPDAPALHGNLGQFFQHTRRPAEAEAAYRRSLQLCANDADIQNGLGGVLMEQGRYSEAENAFLTALEINPVHLEALGNLGMALAAIGRYGESEAAYQKALTVKPDSPWVLHRLANLYAKQSRDPEAETMYRRALKANPNFGEASSNLAVLLQKQERYAEAEQLHRTAVTLCPASGVIQFNFGQHLYELHRYAESSATLERAVELSPELLDAYSVLGNLYKETGRYSEAEETYGRALAFDPHLNWAHYNLALLHLSRQHFQLGWEGYERRWNVPNCGAHPRPFQQVTWGGENSQTESLLVWQEQGVGDVVLYAGLIPDLVARGQPLMIECEKRLTSLFARSFPMARVVAQSDPPDNITRAPHWQTPFGSLCRWLRRSESDFVWRGPYLVPDFERVSRFKNRYRALDHRPVVGISWRSSNKKVGRWKSMQLSDWSPVLRSSGATFVNLQYGDCADELSRLYQEIGVSVYCDDEVDPLVDLDAFAAQVAAMDLVISVSNTTVHFAGALGKPVWTLLPGGGDGLLWYWGNEGERNLWYPTMRIFRQDTLGDWAGAINHVDAAFRDFLSGFDQV